MRGENRYYTFIIASATGSRFYRLALHHRQLCIITIGCLVGLTLLASTSVWVFWKAGLLVHYDLVQRENRMLKQEHTALLQRLQARLEMIDAESDQIRQTAAEMGLSLDGDLEASAEGVTSGVGGPSKLDSFASELNRVAESLKDLQGDLHTEKKRLDTTPAGWPVRVRITSGFGRRRNPFGTGYERHSGIDISGNPGEPVVATADGTVIYAGWRGGYGKVVVIDHGGGLRTFYGHLSRIDISVGDHVKRADRVGLVGRTGRATAPHVHYEIRLNDHPVNPRKFGLTW